MAFHWQTFRTRALTAILFVAVMAAGLLISKWGFLLLFTVVHFGGWAEFLRLRRQFPDRSSTGISVGDLLGGGLYLTLPLFLLCDLRFDWLHTQTATGDAGLDDVTRLSLVLLLIFSIWINDTMAYIVGSLIGKTPLSPISPKKTWEGTAGGALLAVGVMSALAWAVDPALTRHAAAISAIAAITGTIGDLFESKLKRTAGVKDSGSFMPGHGGFLDRFDSLLFAAPCVWLYVALAL
ncbi:phosphatidate cytidylyltransferase [Flaviaesturariibacter aridisoli]|uniref:Phosphatidate cytidylyltransferase n=1 Tax=Flaviaesturariibacter aridisoli TaxID=2545761 RepID=A0A4R4E1X8_9BACT|nr:phosphatidate cytidylyltransferase [Flaviaesturariibacter aridisoli]TCZ72215.1 phosphatidate cytidylyltransferase [Flaviaesturariibacter aridisoli]